MNDLYSQSWALYKAHTESFQDDISYYSAFVADHSGLELFAGYGRVANQLIKQGKSLECVEIEKQFAQFIGLPEEKNHVCDVLHYTPGRAFDRIYAAYNSFCLFTKNEDIQKFFHQLAMCLPPGGQASLNYYHPNYWEDAVPGEFEYNGERVHYIPTFDLSKRQSDKKGLWIDEYLIDGKTIRHEYVTQIYESEADLMPFIEAAGLKLINIIEDFGASAVTEPGWIDYILEK